MKRTETVRTKRLTICPMTDEELHAKRDGETDPETKNAYSEMLAGCEAHPDERIWYTDWCIRLKDGTPIGGIGFKGTACFAEVELGYAIDEAYRGNGYASEAVRAMVDWAFSRSEEIFYVMAEVIDGNEVSIRVLEKNGFSAVIRGKEGMRYARTREQTSMSGVFLCFGMAFGTSIGSMFHNMALGMSFGILGGLALGACLDSAAKKRQAEAERIHREHYGLTEEK